MEPALDVPVATGAPLREAARFLAVSLARVAREPRGAALLVGLGMPALAAQASAVVSATPAFVANRSWTFTTAT